MSFSKKSLAIALALALTATTSAYFGTPARAVAQDAPIVWLDDLDLSQTICGYNDARKGVATDGGPATIAGTHYNHAIGTHSPGAIVVQLPADGIKHFRANFGLADETNGQGHVKFRVFIDGEERWASDYIVGKQPAVPCDISFTGKQFLLYIDAGPEGYGYDHVIIGDPRFEFDTADAAKDVATVRPLYMDDDGNAVTMQNTDDPDEFEIVKEFTKLTQEVKNGMRDNVAATARTQEATILKTDKDPVDVVVRRVSALLETLQEARDDDALNDDAKAWEALLADYEASQDGVGMNAENAAKRYELFKRAFKIRRSIALKNPLLDFDNILFIKRHYCPEPEREGNHMVDQFFGFHARPGGGLFMMKKAFSGEPEIVNVLENSVVQNGRLKGTKLDDTWGFLAPHLSYDGKKIFFAAADTKSPRHVYEWTTENAYHLFSVNIDGSELTQLTDGPWDDIDPCLLPNGRVAFISERRGGYGRCHARPCPSYTLHSMNADGSDIVALSVHETNEWAPTVDKNGMIVYTRWDYVDRGFNQAHHPWITFPDGRDSRAIQGNYSEDQGSRPHFETSLKQIPDSNLFVATASGHHTQNFGSIILIDPMVQDDDVGDDPMAPIQRVTPEQLFPEAEIGTHGPPHNFGQPFPLSEDFYLVVYDAFSASNKGEANDYGIYLLDSFGNKVLLYRDDKISCQHPIPVITRTVPPVIPNQTLIGLTDDERAKKIVLDELPKTATVGLVDVYKTTRPFPEGTKIKELRIVQMLPKTTVNANVPWIGFAGENGARKVLGTVPVEEDGSARFEAPVNVPFYMQALDENGVAVQTMRSATYVHPGETLTCLGCHEGRFNTNQNADSVTPTAFTRAPSKIVPDVKGSNPFNYPTLVQTVLDKNCVECHEQGAKEGKTFELGRGPEDQYFLTSYINLRPYVYVTGNGNANPSAPVHEQPTHGGAWNAFINAKTYPGQFGANRSPLWKLLNEGHHDVKLTPEEKRALALWMDNNCDFFGAYEVETLQAQRRGEVVVPTLE